MNDYSSNIIVTVDDFGIDESTNQSVLALARSGKIDRVAVMVYGRLQMEEINELKNLGLSLDLHLETPILNLKKPSLSVFKRLLIFLWCYSSGRLSKKKLESIWEKQIEKFYETFNCYPDGLNSHEHLHFFPQFFPVVLNLAEKYHCRYVRFGRLGIVKSHFPVGKILTILRKFDLPLFSQKSLASTDFLASFDWLKDMKELDTYLKKGTVELIFHPQRIKEKEALEQFKRS